MRIPAHEWDQHDAVKAAEGGGSLDSRISFLPKRPLNNLEIDMPILRKDWGEKRETRVRE